jgi:predicted butyrate kinase (DUF1464 family)
MSEKKLRRQLQNEQSRRYVLEREVEAIDALAKTPQGKALINRAIAGEQRRMARKYLEIARTHKKLAEQFDLLAEHADAEAEA